MSIVHNAQREVPPMYDASSCSAYACVYTRSVNPAGVSAFGLYKRLPERS